LDYYLAEQGAVKFFMKRAGYLSSGALAVYTGHWSGEIGEDDYPARRAERFEYLVSAIMVMR
jgi:hypothetical protein